jgi:chorismate mutase/prephenate dehydratase
MKNTLEQLRHEIDKIDTQLLTLLGKRAEYACKARLYKHKSDRQPDGIYDPEREQHVISHLLQVNQSVLSSYALTHIFQTIINECRALQTNENLDKVVISLQGDHGSFSEQAAKNFIIKHIRTPCELRYDLTPTGVVDALSSHKADYGVLAVNNAWGGLVNESIAALAAKRYRIMDIMPMRVIQCLLTQTGQNPERITKIISHRQALRQCRNYLTKHYPNAKQLEYADTALAARDCASGQLGDNVAVIASERCVNAFSLELIARSIQDLADNDTLFIAIRRFDSSGIIE